MDGRSAGGCDLDGRRALVAGGGRNLGAAAALELARRGATVAINSRRESAESRATAEAIAEITGSRPVVVYGDVSDPGEARRVVLEAAGRLGGLDVLVCTVGRGPMRPFLELEPEEWTQVLHANLTSLCFLAQAVLPGMLEGGFGRIIGTGGHTNLRGDAQRTATAAGKAGLIGLVRSLSSEFHPRGVTANLISPGAFETSRDGVTGTSNEQRRVRLGLTRLGRPEEFAATCAFLASPSAGYLTGQNILLNGGMLYQ